MTNISKRGLLQTSALMTAGAVIGCATPGVAQNTVKTPFNVPATYIPIVGSDELYPVRRIYCIGRNYAAHAREMGSDPTREPPFFFQKPTDAIQYVAAGTVADHPYPTLTKNYHYEAELVAALGKGGRHITLDRHSTCLRLHAGSGHDATRPATCHGRREEALGNRQEL